MRSAFVDHGACHVSDSFCQLASFLGSSSRVRGLFVENGSSKEHLTAIKSTISPVSTLIPGIAGSLLARSCSLQTVCLHGFISSAALLRADARLSQLCVIGVRQIRCLVLAQSFADCDSKPQEQTESLRVVLRVGLLWVSRVAASQWALSSTEQIPFRAAQMQSKAGRKECQFPLLQELSWYRHRCLIVWRSLLFFTRENRMLLAASLPRRTR